MACGFGACMGCVVPVKGGEGHRAYHLVCKDGPVFDARDIRWV
jgi:dihydroorotate dehydrogenase electron transfer subunit